MSAAFLTNKWNSNLWTLLGLKGSRINCCSQKSAIWTDIPEGSIFYQEQELDTAEHDEAEPKSGFLARIRSQNPGEDAALNSRTSSSVLSHDDASRGFKGPMFYLF